MDSLRISEKSGAFEVFAQVEELGNDLLVVLWGGPTPHIGAVGMAETRPSLRDKKLVSATSSVFTFLGHKEDTVAKRMSEELAKKLQKKVVVVAGMHWDGLKDREIEEIIEVCQRIEERILNEMGGK
ncbi:MAG: hypothetical protein GTN81_01470 [Proteobacteria bacterium]|nr:hypothetical protein [Pseudomonadota bacterium]